ncbi:MAG: hypothetical protein HY738_11850 [Bacteroidia bacterium]|nr:hypothetical protein [Bacteroidia bacterium]
MKTLTSSLFIHLLRINVTAAFCILFLFMASAQKQYISGKGMPNFANVKNSRTVQKLQLDLSKNPGKYQHYLNAKQNLQQKKFPGANIQKFRERSEQISINISEANFNKNKKPTPAEQIDFIHKHKSDSSNIYLYFYNYCYYCWDSSCFTTDVAFLFSAYIWIDYPQDTSDITVIINFGDGADTTLNPFCYWNYFNDSLSTYECYDFIALALHAYSSPGIYTPTCTVITSTGDIVSQSYYEPITIYPGAPPSPSITYFDSYSGQYCWNGVLNDYGNYFYFELYYPFFQSFSDVFIINIDFGDGNDTMYQATIPNQIDWWWWGYFCPPYFWFDAVHKYSQAGTYTVTSTVTFPDGYTDTAASIAYIADHCVTIGGKVFIDEDGDCIPDTDEAGVSDVWLYIPYDYDSLYYDSSFYYSPCYNVYWDNWAYTDTNGDYWFSFPNICPVSNKIMFDPYYNFYPLDNLPLSCPESGYYNFSTDNPSLDYNFALGCTSGYDLQGFVWGWRLAAQLNS